MDAAKMASTFNLDIVDAQSIVNAVERLAWINTSRMQQVRHAVHLLHRVEYEIWCIEGAMEGVADRWRIER